MASAAMVQSSSAETVGVGARETLGARISDTVAPENAAGVKGVLDAPDARAPYATEKEQAHAQVQTDPAAVQAVAVSAAATTLSCALASASAVSAAASAASTAATVGAMNTALSQAVTAGVPVPAPTALGSTTTRPSNPVVSFAAPPAELSHGRRGTVTAERGLGKKIVDEDEAYGDGPGPSFWDGVAAARRNSSFVLTSLPLDHESMRPRPREDTDAAMLRGSSAGSSSSGAKPSFLHGGRPHAQSSPLTRSEQDAQARHQLHAFAMVHRSKSLGTSSAGSASATPARSMYAANRRKTEGNDASKPTETMPSLARKESTALRQLRDRLHSGPHVGVDLQGDSSTTVSTAPSPLNTGRRASSALNILPLRTTATPMSPSASGQRGSNPFPASTRKSQDFTASLAALRLSTPTARPTSPSAATSPPSAHPSAKVQSPPQQPMASPPLASALEKGTVTFSNLWSFPLPSQPISPGFASPSSSGASPNVSPRLSPVRDLKPDFALDRLACLPQSPRNGSNKPVSTVPEETSRSSGRKSSTLPTHKFLPPPSPKCSDKATLSKFSSSPSHVRPLFPRSSGPSAGGCIDPDAFAGSGGAGSQSPWGERTSWQSASSAESTSTDSSSLLGSDSPVAFDGERRRTITPDTTPSTSPEAELEDPSSSDKGVAAAQPDSNSSTNAGADEGDSHHPAAYISSRGTSIPNPSKTPRSSLSRATGGSTSSSVRRGTEPAFLLTNQTRKDIPSASLVPSLALLHETRMGPLRSATVILGADGTPEVMSESGGSSDSQGRDSPGSEKSSGRSSSSSASNSEAESVDTFPKSTETAAKSIKRDRSTRKARKSSNDKMRPPSYLSLSPMPSGSPITAAPPSPPSDDNESVLGDAYSLPKLAKDPAGTASDSISSKVKLHKRTQSRTKVHHLPSASIAARTVELTPWLSAPMSAPLPKSDSYDEGRKGGVSLSRRGSAVVAAVRPQRSELGEHDHDHVTVFDFQMSRHSSSQATATVLVETIPNRAVGAVAPAMSAASSASRRSLGVSHSDDG